MYASTTIVGKLGADPETRKAGETTVTNFSVAVDAGYTGKDGKHVDKTIWYRVSVWGKQGENCARYLARGRTVLVVGAMQESKPYESKDGNWRCNLELRAESVRFMGGRGKDDGSADNGGDNADGDDAGSDSGSKGNGGNRSGNGDDVDFMGDSGGGTVPW